MCSLHRKLMSYTLVPRSGTAFGPGLLLVLPQAGDEVATRTSVNCGVMENVIITRLGAESLRSRVFGEPAIILTALVGTIIVTLIAVSGGWLFLITAFGIGIAWTFRFRAVAIFLLLMASLAAAPLPLQQAAFVGGASLLGLRYGLRWFAFLPVGAYGAALLITLWNPAGYAVAPLQQSLRSIYTFAVPWLLLSIAWPRVEAAWRVRVLTVLALLPSLSVILGGLLHVAGIRRVITDSSSAGASAVGRLSGAMIPPELAMVCVVATMAALYLVLSKQVAWMTSISLVNIGIAAGTVTRGALIALTVVLIGFFLAIPLRLRGRFREYASVRALVIVSVLLPMAFLVGPAILARSSAGDGSSGRLDAWQRYLGLLGESPIWGLGVGAADTIIIKRGAFEAPHNEYLRFALDMGWLGAAFLFGSVVLVYTLVLWRAGRLEKYFSWFCFAALALYAFTDNAVSTPAFTLLFAIFVGVLGAGTQEQIDSSSGSHMTARSPGQNDAAGQGSDPPFSAVGRW